MDTKLKNRIIQILRRASYSHKPRSECKRKSRVAPATYNCNICKKNFYEGKKDLSKCVFPDGMEVEAGKICIDHIEPVIPVTGWENFDSFIMGLFCEESNLQVICKPCHNIKTEEEKEQRKTLRSKNVKSK